MNKQSSQKISRNSPCPCGSGLKYKKCCFGKNAASTVTGASTTSDLFNQAQFFLQNNQHQQAIKCYQKILAADPENVNATHYLGVSLHQNGEQESAMEYLYKSIELKPDDATFHNNMGMVLSESNDLAGAERHFKIAVRLDRKYIDAQFNLANVYIMREKAQEAVGLLSPLVIDNHDDLELAELYARALEQNNQSNESIEVCDSILKKHANRKTTKEIYGAVLAAMGRFDEADKIYASLCESQAKNADYWLERAWWAENQNNLDQAEAFSDEALQQAGLSESSRHKAYGQKARILRLRNRLDEARLLLDKIKVENLSLSEQIPFYQELGQIEEKSGNFSSAYDAYKQSKEARKNYFSIKYSRESEMRKSARLKTIFTEKNISTWKSCQVAHIESKHKPVFILGFMRSGTTLVEQILSTHTNISAGGELVFMGKIESEAASVLNSSADFPDCMMDLSGPGRSGVLKVLSEKYFNFANEYNLLRSEPWLTDKAPLNSTKLAMINLLFPQSPIIHTIRHPLDVCLSSFFTNFKNQNWYATSLEDTAFYFKEVFELVEHYKKNIPDLKYLPIKYEDIVLEPEPQVRRMLDFMGEPYEESCLEFYKSKRVARTASYAQVNQKLYTSSMYRYKNYRKQVEAIIPILLPVIESLGYTIDDS